jgi:hypothetical protein
VEFVAEVPDLGLNEVLGQAWHQVRQPGVGGQRDPAHLPMVVTHEADVAQQAADVRPFGKRAGVEDDARQPVMRRQPGVGCRGCESPQRRLLAVRGTGQGL